MRGAFLFRRNTFWMNALRKPRLNSTVVSVAAETFFSASRLRDESMSLSPLSLDRDLLDDLADAQPLRTHAQPSAAAHRQRHGAPRDAAAALQVEDEFRVQPAPPSLEVADLEARVARIDRAAARGLDLDEDARVERELLPRVEDVGRQVAGVADLDLDAAAGGAHVHLE